MTTPRQLDQIKFMLLADMPTMDDRDYEEARAKLAAHEWQCILCALMVIAWICMPVLIGVLRGINHNGYDFLDVFAPCIWAYVGWLAITSFVEPRWTREDEQRTRLRREMRWLNDRSAYRSMRKHDRLEEWRSNGYGIKEVR